MLAIGSYPRVYRPLINREMPGPFEQGGSLQQRADRAGLRDALVFFPTEHYRNQGRTGCPDVYVLAFVANDPMLRNPVIYARDLGPRNAQLMACYPDRRPYAFNPRGTDIHEMFTPLSRPAPP
jgi:hypothetical protein